MCGPQGILPYAGLKFYVYQTMKNHYRTRLITEDKKQQQLQQQQQQQEGQPVPTLPPPLPPPLPHKQQQLHSEEHQLPPPPPFETAVEQAQAAEEELEEQQRPQKLPVAVTLMFGGVAGLVAQTVTYPLVRFNMCTPKVDNHALRRSTLVQYCPDVSFQAHVVNIGCSIACDSSAA